MNKLNSIRVHRSLGNKFVVSIVAEGKQTSYSMSRDKLLVLLETSFEAFRHKIDMPDFIPPEEGLL